MNQILKNDFININNYINHKISNNYIYNIKLIVHICHKYSIINNEKYISFMNAFGKDVEHIN